MRRREVLATVATAATAGCTASAENEPRASEIEVTGLDESTVYHDYQVSASALGKIMYGGEYRLDLVYDDSADYDPSEHEVYLMDGHEVLDEVSEEGTTEVSDDPAIMLHLESGEVEDGATYRVVSKYPAGVVDDFEITLHTEGGTE